MFKKEKQKDYIIVLILLLIGTWIACTAIEESNGIYLLCAISLWTIAWGVYHTKREKEVKKNGSNKQRTKKMR